MHQITRRFSRFALALAALSVLLSGCKVQLISAYDDITDKAIAELQHKTATFFVGMYDDVGTEKAKYENHKDFYKDVKVSVSALQVRADAIEKNDITIRQLSLLRKMIDDLEALHKLGFRSANEIVPLERGFNSAFTAMIKLQMAKKAGTEK